MMLVCAKCHDSVQRLMILALLHDMPGVRMSNPADCPYGGDHDFVDNEPKEEPK